MAFNWKMFAAGFMEDQTKQINERMRQADAYQKKIEEEFERSKNNYQKRRTFVNQAMTQVNNLRRLGASDQQIKAAVAAGPETLFTFGEQLTKEAQKAGKSTFSASEIDAIVDMPDTFKETEMSVNEFIERSYGLTKPTTGSTKAPKRNIFERAFGVGLESEVRARADQEAAYDGYSMMDLNELARQDTYTSLVPGTYFSITPTVAYDSVDVMSKYTREIDLAVKRLSDNPDYIRAKAENPQLAEQMKAQRIMQITSAYSNKYGTRFLTDPAIDVEGLVGADAYKILQVNYGAEEEYAKTIAKELDIGKTKTIKGGTKDQVFEFEVDEQGEVIGGSFNGQPIPDNLLDSAYEDAITKGYVKGNTLAEPSEPMTDEEIIADDALSALGIPTIEATDLTYPSETVIGESGARRVIRDNLPEGMKTSANVNTIIKAMEDEGLSLEDLDTQTVMRWFELNGGKLPDLQTQEDAGLAEATMPAEEKAAIEQQTRVFFDSAKKRGIMDNPAKLEDFLNAYAEKNRLSEALVMSLRQFIKNM